jgi:hypothetical protein
MYAFGFTAGCLTGSSGALLNLERRSGLTVRFFPSCESRLLRVYVRKNVGVQIGGLGNALQATARVVAVNKAPRARREANLAGCYEIEGEILRIEPLV